MKLNSCLVFTVLVIFSFSSCNELNTTHNLRYCPDPHVLNHYETLDLLGFASFNLAHQDEFIEKFGKDEWLSLKNGDLWSQSLDLYVDIRDSEGVSNWADLRMDCTITGLYSDESTHGKRIYDISVRISNCEDVQTDPVSLFLCVPKWDHDWSGTPIDWVVESIVDSQGGDLSIHPDWACMVDNHYKFYPGGNFKYYPGDQRCDDEPSALAIMDVLESDFDIIKNNDDTHSIFIQATGDMFDVVNVDWESLTISAKRNGETGTIKLKPAS